MSRRAAVAMALAFLFPGAGHLYLGRRLLALAFSAIIVSMLLIGLGAGGDLYTFDNSRGDFLQRLAALGSMGTGGLYVLALAGAPYGPVPSRTFEQGATFTLTAGLMNLLLILDCYDRATGRRTS